jgi:hypothetical protein
MRINICYGNLGSRSNICNSVHVVCKSLLVEKIGCIRAAIVVETLLIVSTGIVSACFYNGIDCALTAVSGNTA